MVVLGGKLHAIGGRFETFEHNTDLHDVYDPATDTWRLRGPPPAPRSGIAAALLGGRIFVIGGEDGGGVFFQNEAYDPATDTWATMAPMPTPSPRDRGGRGGRRHLHPRRRPRPRRQPPLRLQRNLHLAVRLSRPGTSAFKR